MPVLEIQYSLPFDSAPVVAVRSPRSYKRKPKNFEMSDAERDARTAIEWLDAVKGYLDFRMGRNWRRLHRPGQRWNETRWYYLDAWRTINTINFAAPKCNCSTYCNPHKKPVQSVTAGKYHEATA